MMNVSVVIPFYQRKKGLLRQAVNSILTQDLPADTQVNIIVVDDGSPASAKEELADLSVPEFFTVKLISQANAGVAVARNAGLAAANPNTDYMAFLDSDDVWLQGHLATAIKALNQGVDFYFCDNRRPTHFPSHFASGELILSHIKKAAREGALIPLSQEDMFSLTLKTFPAQLSTVFYRYTDTKDITFDPSMKVAGEDIIFLLRLISRLKHICFSPDIEVECGQGINLYFSTTTWDGPGCLQRVITEIRSRFIINDQFSLTKKDRAWTNLFIRRERKKAAYLIVRKIAKSRNIPEEVRVIAKDDPKFFYWFPYYAIKAVVGRSLGLYMPD